MLSEDVGCCRSHWSTVLTCPRPLQDTAFKQQRLKAWQPILTPRTVLPTLFLIGILFAPIGGLLIWGSNLVRRLMRTMPEDRMRAG